MTEAEWLTTDDLPAILNAGVPLMSKRKATLYVCGGLRRLWHLLYDDASKNAVAVLEFAADGISSQTEVESAKYAAESPTFGCEFDGVFVRNQYASDHRYSQSVLNLINLGVYDEKAIWTSDQLGSVEVRNRLINLAHIVYHAFDDIWENRLSDALVGHILQEPLWPRGWLLREVLGNPLQLADRSCFSAIFGDNKINTLAHAIYHAKMFGSLPVLADALKEAGCSDWHILTHCREQSGHLAGCWVLDLILGKS